MSYMETELPGVIAYKEDMMHTFYPIDKKYKTEVAYFSMEFAVHQAFKTYSGGLGFLSGSHMRSAYALKQNMIGVGVLWTYGYYDQERKEDRSLEVVFRRKYYDFLEDTGIKATVHVHGFPVIVKALLLPPDAFKTAPIYFLTTDIPENDYLSRTITQRLYDNNEDTRIAQEIVLGIGGAKVLELAGKSVEVYHINEGHALPLAFYLYGKHHNLESVKKQFVFTTHTPEKAGNEEHNMYHLAEMGFFHKVPLEEVKKLTSMYDENFSLTLAALRLAKAANGVSKKHQKTAEQMWKQYEGICPIAAITNGQDQKYWADRVLLEAFQNGDDTKLLQRKRELKEKLFDIVADQTGKLFDPDVLTIVWARRFAEYKRPALIKRDYQRFLHLISATQKPVQIIWAGKPYPHDSGAVNLFNELIHTTKNLKRVAVLIKYELEFSMRLKRGADVWLSNPRVTREACGTSGMSAAMNASVVLSTADGWFPEFSKDRKNSFIMPLVDGGLSADEQDGQDNKNLMNIIEHEIIPIYYDKPKKWLKIMKSAMKDILPAFSSDRMADEYYTKLYNHQRVLGVRV